MENTDIAKAIHGKTVLVVDDEKGICEMLAVALKKWGVKAKFAHTFHDGIALAERGGIDLILSDIKLPDGSGVDILNRAKSLPEEVPVLLMTAFGDTDAAVKAVKLGAFYYLTKPFKLDELKVLLERALTDRKLHVENDTLKKDLKKDFSIKSFIGKSKAMKELFEMIERVASTKTNIIITGESGTGKELVARAIHYGGPLKNKPFVAINCGAIPENLIESEMFGHKKGSFTGAVVDKDGLFRVADGGSIFLDEVGELPMTMQVKLLRVLQDRSFRPVGGTESVKVDVRVISATNRDLEKAIADGTFREDLYYRLNVINIKTAPLRERREDIPLLVDHFLKKYSLGMGKANEGIVPEAMDALLKYDFPGNVRELENIMERAIALEGEALITVESLPPVLQKYVKGGVAFDTPAGEPAPRVILKDPHSADEVSKLLTRGAVNLEEIVGSIEKEYILKALAKSGGVKKKAAELLGITFRSLRYRISKYGIHDTEGPDDSGEPEDES